MALILLLSDLHLVDPSASPALGDHKGRLVPLDDRTTYHQLLRDTLAGVRERLADEGRALDAIVMCGDVADRNAPAGYAAFLDLLDALGTARPPASHIVVVPGNHDVVKGLTPGDAARYEPFATTMRDAGFVTPLPDGIGSEKLPPDGQTGRYLVRVGDLEIVPLNSAAYSQVRLDIGVPDAAWEAAVKAAMKAAGGPRGGGKRVGEALERLRQVDAARVSGRHLQGVRALLQRASGAPTTRRARASAPRPPLRVAVLHHQILPVSTREEVKPYESFTNLALLREFLRNNDVALVLHGHKHASHTYVDYVTGYDKAGASEPREIRVISGPAPTGATLNEADVFRLLDIDAEAATVTMESVPAVLPGSGAARGTSETFLLARPGAAVMTRTPGATLIDGESIAAVYARLVPAVLTQGAGDDNPKRDATNVICHIARAPELQDVATLYDGFRPQDAGGDEDDDEKPADAAAQLERFTELVRWWQHPEGVAGGQPGFTHGSRIYRYEGYLDQLDAVAAALAAKPDTSRAVVVLLQPAADRVADSARPFPSFCLVQFAVRYPGGGEPPRLDCVAYFRKQEVRYWWLVNVAELVGLQRRVVDKLRAVGGANLALVTPGSVTTMAARAHAGRSAPKVQVPKVDQHFAVARERLSEMVMAVFWTEMPGREALAHEWERLLTDLIPEPERAGEVAVAVDGLRYLATEMRRHAAGGWAGAAELAGLLDHLAAENAVYASDQQTRKVTPLRHAAWRDLVRGDVARIVELTAGGILGRRQPADLAR